MLLFVILAYFHLASCQDEPISEADIFHTWDVGFEGYFYLHPSKDIHEWVVHLILNQPVDSIIVCNKGKLKFAYRNRVTFINHDKLFTRKASFCSLKCDFAC